MLVVPGWHRSEQGWSHEDLKRSSSGGENIKLTFETGNDWIDGGGHGAPLVGSNEKVGHSGKD